MQFRTSQRRALWRDFALGLIVDIFIAWILASIWGRGDPFEVGMTYLGLQVAYLLIWSRRTAGMWLWFWLGGRKRQSEHIADFLRERRFPQPDSYYGSPEDYLQQTAADGNLKPDIRLAAATELASLNAIAQVGLMQRAIQLNLAYEDAIKKYSRSFPAKSDDDQGV